MADNRKLAIKLVKSLIGCSEKQKRVVNGLGLYKTNQVVNHFDSETIRGMLKKIPHLLEVEAV